jgi:hypothetical protein
MMNLWRAAVAALFAIVLVAATANASTRCVTGSELEAFLARQAPAASARSFGGEDAKMILASLANATNTVAPAADGLMIVDLSPVAPAVKIVVFRNGCMERIGTFPRHIVTRALNDLAKLGA